MVCVVIVATKQNENDSMNNMVCATSILQTYKHNKTTLYKCVLINLKGYSLSRH